MRGIERIGEEPARVTQGDLRRQVMGLLRNYSYVVLQSENNGVRGVRILASRGLGRPDVQAAAVSTPTAEPRSDEAPVHEAPAGDDRAKIDGQALYATLMGFGGHEHEMSLTVDLRVQAVILPMSMKAVLGFDGASLGSGAAKLARGEVPAETGLLPAVSIGENVAENVEVAFVADDALDDGPLLGKAFMRNFNVSYDRETAQLILMPL